jgi:hypothetical protein
MDMFMLYFLFLFIGAYNVWFISPRFPTSSLTPPPPPSAPIPSIPGKNYFALISNFVEERV